MNYNDTYLQQVESSLDVSHNVLNGFLANRDYIEYEFLRDSTEDKISPKALEALIVEFEQLDTGVKDRLNDLNYLLGTYEIPNEIYYNLSRFTSEKKEKSYYMLLILLFSKIRVLNGRASVAQKDYQKIKVQLEEDDNNIEIKERFYALEWNFQLIIEWIQWLYGILLPILNPYLNEDDKFLPEPKNFFEYYHAKLDEDFKLDSGNISISLKSITAEPQLRIDEDPKEIERILSIYILQEFGSFPDHKGSKAGFERFVTALTGIKDLKGKRLFARAESIWKDPKQELDPQKIIHYRRNLVAVEQYFMDLGLSNIVVDIKNRIDQLAN